MANILYANDSLRAEGVIKSHCRTDTHTDACKFSMAQVLNAECIAPDQSTEIRVMCAWRWATFLSFALCDLQFELVYNDERMSEHQQQQKKLNKMWVELIANIVTLMCIDYDSSRFFVFVFFSLLYSILHDWKSEWCLKINATRYIWEQ